MLVPVENTKNPVFDAIAQIDVLLKEPSPRSGAQMMSLEQRALRSGLDVADSVVVEHLVRAHGDEQFVEEAIASARAKSPVPLRHKGIEITTILLLGGTRVTLATPYLREDLSGRRGRRRTKRRQSGSGCYPVLEALGIRDRVSPATRSEIALFTVQSASYQEAARMLERRGMSVDRSTIARVAVATAHESVSLREAALTAALEQPIPEDGPLSGTRVRVSLDGGRVRTRVVRRGRRTAKGRRSFRTPWREPRLLVIDILDEEGKSDRLRLPLYDVAIAEADAVWALVIGYLRMLGAAAAEQVVFIADAAPWIWQRVEWLSERAGIARERIVEVIDFYHGCDHLSKTIELCKNLSAPERKKLYRRLRRHLRYDADGVEQVIEQMMTRAVTRRGKAIKKGLAYFREHAERMRYSRCDEMKVPVGSGQVESAIRRVINLRFKAPGSFWDEERVDGLMHLRAAFKSGRWDEILEGVLSTKFTNPNFDITEKNSRRTPAKSMGSPRAYTVSLEAKKAA